MESIKNLLSSLMMNNLLDQPMNYPLDHLL
jgi:hypothetical protein